MRRWGLVAGRERGAGGRVGVLGTRGPWVGTWFVLVLWRIGRVKMKV